MTPTHRPLAVLLLLPLGLAWGEAGTPAEIAARLETFCMGADQMLLTALPGQYVSCRLAGESCQGAYIPGVGAIIQFRVAFPLVPAASRAQAAAGEVAAASADAAPAASGEHVAQGMNVQVHQIVGTSVANSYNLTQVIYQQRSNLGYDPARRDRLVGELSRILSHYSDLLKGLPENETLTFVVTGTVDTGVRRPPPQRPSGTPAYVMVGSPTPMAIPVVDVSQPSGGMTFQSANFPPAAGGRSTLIVSLPAGQLCGDAQKTRAAMTCTSY